MKYWSIENENTLRVQWGSSTWTLYKDRFSYNDNLGLNLCFVLTTYCVIIILDRVKVQEYYNFSLKLGQKKKLVLFNTSVMTLA